MQNLGSWKVTPDIQFQLLSSRLVHLVVELPGNVFVLPKLSIKLVPSSPSVGVYPRLTSSTKAGSVEL